MGRQLRSSGGIILHLGENQFHIDPGPGALTKAKEYGISLRATTAILVSHAHMNHGNDVNAVIDGMTYRGFDKKGVLLGSESVVNGYLSYPPVVNQFYKNCLERFIVVRPLQRVAINEIEIQMLPCDHTDPSAVGFKFFTPEFTLVYSGDTKFSKKIIESYKNSKIVILNVVSQKGDGKNLSVADAIKIVNEVRPRLCILTHFGISMLEADPLSISREIYKETGVDTIAAKDGMIVNPLSYSVSQGQTTLNPYTPPREIEVKEILKEIDIEKALEENKTLNELFGAKQ